MDLHVPPPPPSSNDGGYDLAEDPAPEAAGPGDATSAPVDASEAKTQVDSTAADAAAEAQAGAEPKPAAAPAQAPTSAKDAAQARARKRRRRARQLMVPAWAVSLLVHAGVFGALTVVTLSTDAGKKLIADINSSLVPTGTEAEAEVTPVYADPSLQKSDQAVGDIHAETVGGAGGEFGGVGSGPPSATPSVRGAGRGVSEKSSLPGIKIAANVSGLSMLPAAPGVDLGGGGLIAGDVTYEAGDVGASLDQIAREILRHLTQHKVTVAWLFDESESMKDDQRAIKERFDRVARELKLAPEAQAKGKGSDPLNHVIVGYGQDIHYELERPTADIERIGRAIEKLRVDETGVENTLHAVNEVIDHYGGQITKDRRLLIVLVTDESGDDGAFVEEAHQAVVGRRVPIYVIGRQSLFGYGDAHLRYVDPVTKDEYWPTIRRGPETADVEVVQWDGLHRRWDEQPSGFAPYELARLTKDSGGIYFLLPSEENMRVKQRERAYKIADLKEYVPDYKSRNQYAADRGKSELRRTLYDVIQATKDFPYPIDFPIDPEQMVVAANEAGSLATERLNALLTVQKRLESAAKLRDREPEKRWQAHYDLMLAQTVVYQIKSFEYRACLAEMIKDVPKPKLMPTPERYVFWRLHHSRDRKAPKDQTEKKYVEATRLLRDVIEKHPKTPWADLAQDELDRGFGVARHEEHHSPQYGARTKLVPKY